MCFVDQSANCTRNKPRETDTPSFQGGWEALTHGTALAIKDFAKSSKDGNKPCPGLHEVYRELLLISNLYSSSEAVRALLVQQQTCSGGKAKAISPHCPTRFAALHLIAVDVQDYEERDFFGEVKQVISLAQPFSDFIHQFEADKPLLSQVLPAWNDLVKHTKAWCASVDEKLSTGALCLSRLAGSEQASCTVREELACLRMSVLPPSLSDICQALSARKKLLGGRVQLAKANHRRHFWSVHMASHYPELAAVAIRVLSAHVTTAAAERNWSVFGQIFSKTRNRLTLDSAKKIAYIRGNSNV
ncbi:hypothetical protein QJQ45_014620 [Haematococcus lacustris]|nr:hypothetical protein QJQ45_014620 [Haematococcus lacustris]